jgi:MYXO-CTERM domain-containing protein
MAAVWQPVPGADGYQVAVTHADTGRIVSAPAWQDVGAATSAEITGLTLAPGAGYVFAVRALIRGAASPDAMSDGVLVGDAAPVPPIPGDPDLPPEMPGCGCRSTEPGSASWLLLAVLAGLIWRPRRLISARVRCQRPS